MGFFSFLFLGLKKSIHHRAFIFFGGFLRLEKIYVPQKPSLDWKETGGGARATDRLDSKFDRNAGKPRSVNICCTESVANLLQRRAGSLCTRDNTSNIHHNRHASGATRSVVLYFYIVVNDDA